MKIPEGLFNAWGGKAEGVVQLRGSDGKSLKEYDAKAEGSKATCLVLTSPGDIITIQFAFDSGVADFADLVVDGILRESASASESNRRFKGTFKRVCHQDRVRYDRRGGLKSCKMEVQSRTTKGDIAWNGEGDPSTVGSVELQLFRRDALADKSTPATGQGNTPVASLDTAKRAPNFHQYAYWRELNTLINLSTAPPPFEIGFTDRNSHGKPMNERVIKSWPREFKVIATLKFDFRSSSDLHSLGFEGVPTYYAPLLPPKSVKPSEMALEDNESKPMHSGAQQILKNDSPSLFMEKSVLRSPTINRKAMEMQSTSTSQDDLEKPRVSSLLQDIQTSQQHNPPKYDNNSIPNPTQSVTGASPNDESSPRILSPSPILRHPIPRRSPTCTLLPREYPLPVERAKSVVLDTEAVGLGPGPRRISDLKYFKKGIALHGLDRHLPRMLLSSAQETEYQGPYNQYERFPQPHVDNTDDIGRGPLSRRTFEEHILRDTMSQPVDSLHPIIRPAFYRPARFGSADTDQVLRDAKTQPAKSIHPIERPSINKPTHYSSADTHNRPPLTPPMSAAKCHPDKERSDEPGHRANSAQRQHSSPCLPPQHADELANKSQVPEPSSEPLDNQDNRRNFGVQLTPMERSVEAVASCEVREPASAGVRAQEISPKPQAADPAQAFNTQRKPPMIKESVPLTCPGSSPDAAVPAEGERYNGNGNSSQKPPGFLQTRTKVPQDSSLAERSRRIIKAHLPKDGLEHNTQNPQYRTGNTQINVEARRPTQTGIPAAQARFHWQRRAANIASIGSEKRKADSINGDAACPAVSTPPRKMSIAPALRKSEDSKRELQAAQARLAAAEKRKQELSKALENVMLLEKTRKLNQEAEQMERENQELQARLDAVYNESKI